MKQSRFTEERIIAILREHEAGSKTGDVCRKYGISSATFCKWKAKYGGLDVSEARRLITPAACLPTGRTTTTPLAHTVRSAICRGQLTQSSQRPTCNGTGRCAMSRAPRPVPLHHRATQAQMTQGLYLSLDERLGSGRNLCRKIERIRK